MSWAEPKTASRWARGSRNRAKDSRGAERTSQPAAVGRSIHSGVNVSVPSARRIVRCTSPPYTTRRLLDATAG
jgi:hypothetical protein